MPGFASWWDGSRTILLSRLPQSDEDVQRITLLLVLLLPEQLRVLPGVHPSTALEVRHHSKGLAALEVSEDTPHATWWMERLVGCLLGVLCPSKI